MFPLARVNTEQLGSQTRFATKSQPLFKAVPTTKPVCLFVWDDLGFNWFALTTKPVFGFLLDVLCLSSFS